MDLNYDDIETLLREQVEHVLVCTSYVQAHFDVKNMSFKEYSDMCYKFICELEGIES